MSRASPDLPSLDRRGAYRRLAYGGAVALAIGAAAWWWIASAGREEAALQPVSVGTTRDEESTEALPPPTPAAALAPDRVEQATRPEETTRAGDEPATADPAAARRGFMLHVVDAKTGAELRGCAIDALPNRDGGEVDFSVDPAAYPPVARGDSPLRIDAQRRGPPLSTLRVAVERYATVTLSVEWTGGGERTVALEASASLTVMVRDTEPGRVQVRVRRADRMEERLDSVLRQSRRRPWTSDEFVTWIASHERALARLRRGAIGPEVDVDLAVALRLARGERVSLEGPGGRAQFDDLAVGRWIVDASHPPNGPARGAAEVVLTAGAQVTIELPLLAAPERPVVRAAGSLRFDADWLASGMPPLPTSMELRPAAIPYVGPLALGEERLVPLTTGDRREVLRFDAGELPPGLVVARIDELSWSTRFEVPAAGSDSLEIGVPPPVRVAVRAFDAAEPDFPVPFRVGWEAFDGAGDGANYPYGSPRRSGHGAPIDLLVPRGTLVLFVGSDDGGFLMNRSRHEISRVTEEIAVELREPVQLEVTLRDGQAIVPCDHEWSNRLYARDASGQPLAILSWASSGLSPSITFTFDRDGPAQLFLDPVDGYAMVAPVAIELKRGEMARVEMAITRARR